MAVVLPFVLSLVVLLSLVVVLSFFCSTFFGIVLSLLVSSFLLSYIIFLVV